MLAKVLPDEVIELINLLLVVVRQCVLLSLLAFDEAGFNLNRVDGTKKRNISDRADFLCIRPRQWLQHKISVPHDPIHTCVSCYRSTSPPKRS